MNSLVAETYCWNETILKLDFEYLAVINNVNIIEARNNLAREQDFQCNVSCFKIVIKKKNACLMRYSTAEPMPPDKKSL